MKLAYWDGEKWLEVPVLRPGWATFTEIIVRHGVTARDRMMDRGYHEQKVLLRERDGVIDER